MASFLTAAVWGLEYATLTGKAIGEKLGLMHNAAAAQPPQEPPAAT